MKKKQNEIYIKKMERKGNMKECKIMNFVIMNINKKKLSCVL